MGTRRALCTSYPELGIAHVIRSGKLSVVAGLAPDKGLREYQFIVGLMKRINSR
jgi:hypothetical protein